MPPSEPPPTEALDDQRRHWSLFLLTKHQFFRYAVISHTNESNDPALAIVIAPAHTLYVHWPQERGLFISMFSVVIMQSGPALQRG